MCFDCPDSCETDKRPSTASNKVLSYVHTGLQVVAKTIRTQAVAPSSAEAPKVSTVDLRKRSKNCEIVRMLVLPCANGSRRTAVTTELDSSLLTQHLQSHPRLEARRQRDVHASLPL